MRRGSITGVLEFERRGQEECPRVRDAILGGQAVLIEHEWGEAAAFRERLHVQLSEVLMDAPNQPSKIICVGRNYAAHAMPVV